MGLHKSLFLILCGFIIGDFDSATALQAEEIAAPWQAADKLYKDGNYQEALDAYRAYLKDKKIETKQIVNGFHRAAYCLQNLNRHSELDEFRESIAETHDKSWQVLAAVAQNYLHSDHHGYLIAGEFKRGNHRGGGKVMNAQARDRVRALQLHLQAFQLIQESENEPGQLEAQWLYQQFADAVLYGNSYYESWRLQLLSDLKVLPDYSEGWASYGNHTQGAPVDPDGNPVFYELPNSWESAKNDGERWRWLLKLAADWDPSQKSYIQMKRARFLKSQFSVQTLAHYGSWFGRQEANDPSTNTGTYALHTLDENETIARLANGIKRFKLPDEHNHIAILRKIVAEEGLGNGISAHASEELVSAFQNRRQYPKAAELLKQLAENAKPQGTNHYQDQLNQIVENWGRFEPVMSQPAGQGATVDFRYRNGRRVEFAAKRINVALLLEDIKAYLKKNPQVLDYQKLQLENLGHRIVMDGEDKYLGKEVARWSLDLEPLHNHFDRRITVTTPLQEPGAYLLTSEMEDGNKTSVVIWLNDTAIIKKPLANKSLYYVADSVNGMPLPECNVEFFGYWHEHIDGKKYQLHTKNFAELTNKDGIIELRSEDKNHPYQWLATATTPEGRFAYLGFQGIWTGQYYDQEYKQVKVFTVTDRPVYRPQQEVKFKFWIRRAQYDLDDSSRFADQTFQVEIRDPKNEKVFSQQVIADAYGGIEGSWEIPEGATLGQYRVNVVHHGGGTFRVEEYKKPEFEVTVEAPEETIKLGDKFKAKISARYYFGEPVAEGKVKYKILRTNYDQRWFPAMPWDWLYGQGYWWFAQDYDWYPGWFRWGCRAPSPWWFWRSQQPPEVVAQQEVEIGSDGTIEVEIDSSLAKKFHPDSDHSYQIQVEVVDQSRRTIVGNGKVLVARQPFRVYLWTQKGYYRVGDTIQIGATARTIAGEPVSGIGELRLLKVQYEQGKPVETEVGSWELSTDAQGNAKLQIKATASGQYRIAYEVEDQNGNKIEGGQVLTVTGEGFDGSEFRFNDIEIVPDSREYQPDDKIALQINTNRIGASVLLFARPANGIYLPPQLVNIAGKSTTIEIDVKAKDSPNFFLEAVTVHGGKVHSAVREIFVPPMKRMLNVEVVPSAEAYLPGQEAKVQLKLTDLEGKPYVGSIVLSIYDKALEYISGGSNVADIREFFWKWRRNHQPQGSSNLQRGSSLLVARDATRMQDLGIFGATVVDEISRSGTILLGGIKRDIQSLGRASRFNSNAMGVHDRSAGIAVPMAARAAPMGGIDGAADELSSVSSREEAFAQGEPITESVNQPAIRENFADTALWLGSLETNAEGLAETKLTMPENLTAWKIGVWAMGQGTRVGQGSAEVVTRKNLIVRMQAPRFFIERDEVVLSANVHNYLPQSKQVRVRLELEGNTLNCPSPLEQTVDIEAGGEKRLDWRVNVQREGTAIIRMSALTDEESDAMQMSFPVYVHGMLKTESYTGVVRPAETTDEFTISIPAERRAEQTRLEVRYSPTLAGAMIDTLPYLLDYPYGCTEQTLNRFLPAVLTKQTLKKMGVNLTDVQQQQTNLNSQEIGDDHERAKEWKRVDTAPVFDNNEMTKIVKAGVNRLTEMQLSDGGWGWFSGWGERSYPHTTAVVMHGLLVAKENNVAIVPSVLERGTAWLQNYQDNQLKLLDNWEKRSSDDQLRYKQFADNLDALVYMVLAEAGQKNDHMLNYLYRDRTKLAVYSLATFGIALHKQTETEKLEMVMRNIRQYVQQDDENQTAWLELPSSGWWYWYGSEYEAHAYYLKLLSAVDPQSEVAPRLVKYLLNNRKHATYWKSTRDTALVVEAFADYLTATGESEPEVDVEIWIDGQKRKEVNISKENLFTFDNKLVLTGDELESGRHTIEIRKRGDSPVYYSGYLTNFTLEEDIRAAGLEIKVERSYYKLTPAEKTASVAGGRGQVVDQKVEKYERTRLVNLAELKSGDLVEVELTVDSKNDYEYILLEDMKAAGFEPVEVRSGYNGNELGAYMELRDDRVSLFVARLARGKHSVSYRLRAEIPGRFSALPTRASAMYAPELKANSDEIKLQIAD